MDDVCRGKTWWICGGHAVGMYTYMWCIFGIRGIVCDTVRSAEKMRLHYQEKAAKWILQDATIVVVEWLAAGV